MALVLPILSVTIGLTLFFGYAMMNQQNVWASDHYAAWRTAYGGGVTAGSMNSNFYMNKGGTINIDTNQPLTPELDGVYQDYANSAGSAASQGLASRMVITNMRGFDRGKTVYVAADFPSRVGLWNKFQGQIKSTAGREGHEWQYGKTDESTAIIDEFLLGVDTEFKGLADKGGPGADMAARVRGLYVGGW